MRTTVRLADDLMREVKQHALKTDRTLTQLIQEALVNLIEREKSQESPRVIELTTFRGDGVQPGVDINSNANLLENMDNL
ncbi:CopG family ribbon-helix-helix protein [Acaryochloris thomasi]|nr:ribbon-helix-helix protein, CopG family [Acaryochloris thomasi]